jgi:hypothetical protein
MSQPKPWVQAGPPQPASLGLQLALGATIAMGGAVVVGVFGGLTTIQSTYVAILLGWLVGLVIRRAGARYEAAAAAGLLSLTGSALASVISGVIIIVRQAHVPLAIVLGHLSTVISLLPHAIGWFGFACWGLSTIAGWATVLKRGPRRTQPDFATLPTSDAAPAAGGDQHGGA